MRITEYSRKLDTMGRIMLPKRLREKLGLIEGNEYTFYTHEEDDGRKFLCIECPGIDQATLEEARRLVEKYGMK